MICAAIDYLKFRFRRGPYSPQRVKEQGGRLATIENFPQYKEWDAGYLFFLHGCDSIKSWAVMYYTNSLWSHTGLFTEKGRVVHATTGGVVEHDFGLLLDGRSYIYIMTHKDKPTAEQKNTIVEFSRKQIGCRFNWPDLIRFWFAIILGSHAHFRPRFALDSIVIFVVIATFGVFHIAISLLTLSCAIGYLIIIAINRHRWKSMKALLGQNL